MMKYILILFAILSCSCATSLDSKEALLVRGDHKPVPIKMAEPEYPVGARKDGLAGVVRVKFDLDSAGHTLNIRIVESPGEQLSTATIRAVENWEFRPGIRDGVPVAVRGVVVDIPFRLITENEK